MPTLQLPLLQASYYATTESQDLNHKGTDSKEGCEVRGEITRYLNSPFSNLTPTSCISRLCGSNLFWFRTASDLRAIGHHGVLGNHHDAVADVVVRAVEVRRLAFRRDGDLVADARILVDNALLDLAVAANAHAGDAAVFSRFQLSISLVEILAHQDAMADRRVRVDT